MRPQLRRALIWTGLSIGAGGSVVAPVMDGTVTIDDVQRGSGVLFLACLTAWVVERYHRGTHGRIEKARQDGYDAGFCEGRRVAKPLLLSELRPTLMAVNERPD